MNRMGNRFARIFFSNMKGLQTVRMASDLMELFGMRRRRNNRGSLFTAVLGAGALAYSMKKMMDNGQQKQHGEKTHQTHNPKNLSPERTSAIKNIVKSYSKNDPGLRAALQEMSSEFGVKENEPTKSVVNNNREKNQKIQTDWEI